MAAPVFESYSRNQSTGDRVTVTVDKPTGTVEGDLLIAYFWHRDIEQVPTAITWPSGWTELLSEGFSQSFDFPGVNIGYKVAGGSEPTTYDFTTADAGSDKACCIVARVSGANTTNPFPDTPTTAQYTSNTNSPDCPSITTSINDSLVFNALCLGNALSTDYFTPPSGVTEITEARGGSNNSHATIVLGYFEQASAGATGAKTWSSSNDIHQTATFAVAPAAGGGTTVNASPVSATWSAVAPSIKISNSPAAVSATWSAVAPSILMLPPTLAPVVATWSVVAPSTTAGVAPSPVSATWSVVAPSTTMTVATSPVSATWSAVTPTVQIAGGVAVDPVSATWSVVTPTTALSLTQTPASATWSVVTPSAGSVVIVTPDPVSATWSVVAPAFSISVTPPSVSATWSAVAPAQALALTVQPVSATWSSPEPRADIGNPPSVPGVEYRAEDARCHYRVPDARPHYTSRGTD